MFSAVDRLNAASEGRLYVALRKYDHERHIYGPWGVWNRVTACWQESNLSESQAHFQASEANKKYIAQSGYVAVPVEPTTTSKVAKEKEVERLPDIPDQFSLF